MGYRANVITQHRKYGGQTFGNWTDFDLHFLSALRDFDIDIFDGEGTNYYEVDKKELQRFVDSLPDNNKKSVAYPEYTNKELKEELQDSINETKDVYVAWEWF